MNQNAFQETLRSNKNSRYSVVRQQCKDKNCTINTSLMLLENIYQNKTSRKIKETLIIKRNWSHNPPPPVCFKFHSDRK